ncbi:MAG TPA: glycoside hydrolase family 38 C-terminal domain-containing protein [Arachidicoccus sp.]|nr:glycoside hydrolase family 38 C-terminal domain-containing protein [Arachidicoccus sp.]
MCKPKVTNKVKPIKRGILLVLGIVLFAGAKPLLAQLGSKAYFVDGFHGGIWGHFPYKYASFIADQMQKNPDWKVNLEIEPVTWDSIEKSDPDGYRFIQQQLADSSLSASMEYVNPAYGQPYMFNISGESIIRQFHYGMETLRKHFPNITFSTYSSEEPCFTSALPGILNAYGFKYASLKNPNTCWGGYTRAAGGELINWVGPDGSSILTVPRYATEKLEEGSTWQTNAWKNDPDYIHDAFAFGIQNPVGMCLQDAGWTEGPWVGHKKGTTYTTWRNYFANVAEKNAKNSGRPIDDRAISQEDIQVSLVWGGQILQRVAKAVRTTENTLTSTETIAALNHVFYGSSWPQLSLDEAWKALLLSQHHDTWIVPYNKKYGKTWGQYVEQWTGFALNTCDSLLKTTGKNTAQAADQDTKTYLRVYNSTGRVRTELVAYTLPADERIKFSVQAKAQGQLPVLLDASGAQIPLQIHSDSDGATLHFEATVPPLGFTTYELRQHDHKKDIKQIRDSKLIIDQLADGRYQLETDLYRIKVDPKRGGIISSLVLKGSEPGNDKGNDGRKANTHEFLRDSMRGINELRGYFYNDRAFHSSQQSPASVKVLANGPLFASLQINGQIAGTPFTQTISVGKKDPLITTDLRIDWHPDAAMGIGAYSEKHSYKNEKLEKAFYNSRYKLLTLFPVNIKDAVVYKDAPFDIYSSKLANTFYSRWDSIKNDVLLHWVNIDQQDKAYGFALFSDQTTSYAQGKDIPLGLTTQYIGRGLFGADYNVDGPSRLRYAIMPHAGDWKQGKVNTASESFNKPLVITAVKAPDTGQKKEWTKSFLSLDPEVGWVVSAFRVDAATPGPASEIAIVHKGVNHRIKTKDAIILRLFNAEGDDRPHRIHLHNRASKVELVQLNGKVIESIDLDQEGTSFNLAIPKLGFRTLRITDN